MIIDSGISTEKEKFIFPPPQFQLDPPGEGPFEALAATSVTGKPGSFNLNWVENPIEIGISKAEGILDDIVSRSRQDVERFPSNVLVHANYAVALMNRGLLNEAAIEFSTALKLSPRHFMSLANLGRLRTLQGRFEEAETIYKQLSSAYPNEVSPLVNLSYILSRTHRLDEATEILQRAIEVDKDAIFPRYLMAVSLLTIGKPHEAIRHLRVAARSEVRSPAIHQTLGAAYLIAGDVKGAVRSFKTALTLAPEMKEAVYALANVLLQQNHTESLVDFLSAYLERHPDDIVAREILAEAYLRRREYPIARLQLTTSLRYLHDGNEGELRHKACLLNNIGVCFDRQGDIENAVLWITRSIEVCPAFGAVPYQNLAKVELRRRQFPRAWQILETCRTIFPSNHETPEVQAAVLAEQHRYDEAIRVLRDEIATGQASPGSYAALGWYLTDFTRDPDTARAVLSEGLKRYPQDPKIVNNLAYTLLMQGRPDEARVVLLSSRHDDTQLRIEDEIALTATWGLLYLWDGDLDRGQEYYQHAAEMAHESHERNLPAIVQQKMHLELAKAYLRQHDIDRAKAETARGLSIRKGREVYERDLLALHEKVRGNLSEGY